MHCKSCKWRGRDTIIMSATRSGKLVIVYYCPRCKNMIKEGDQQARITVQVDSVFS